MKYKVEYTGFAYVEADDEEEAKEIFWYGLAVVYDEKEITSVNEIDEFELE